MTDSRLDRASLPLLGEALRYLDEGFSRLPPLPPVENLGALDAVLQEVAGRLRDNDPYFHPLYVGQMLKPPNPIARLAYALALWINPNNHALDGGRASSAMEIEAVRNIAGLFGWRTHLGHLCGGGTLANLEALWIAREQHPGKAILASSQAHYTHRRLASLLGVPFRDVEVDAQGRMDVDHLQTELAKGDVGLVVATMGTTALGAVDPLPLILDHAAQAGARVHADAAYGGFFTLASTLAAPAQAAFDALGRVDSIVIDPHKHGLQPYGCGCILFRDPSVAAVYEHDSPYTYFSSDDLHLGRISLECSRPGAAAVALWATQRLLPYTTGGVFATDLDRCLGAARRFAAHVAAHPKLQLILEPELDIVVFCVRAPTSALASAGARRVYERTTQENLHLALATLPKRLVGAAIPGTSPGDEDVLCLRATLMKPEHEDWLTPIFERLDRALA